MSFPSIEILQKMIEVEARNYLIFLCEATRLLSPWMVSTGVLWRTGQGGGLERSGCWWEKWVQIYCRGYLAAFITARQRCCGKVMFSKVSVNLFTGGVPPLLEPCLLGLYAPWDHTPSPGTIPPLGTIPPWTIPLWTIPIWNHKSGWYTFHWNAFLFHRSKRNNGTFRIYHVTGRTNKRC